MSAHAPAPVLTPAATYARDVRVTWWYTAASVMVLHVFAVFMWAFVVVLRGTPLDIVLALVGAAGSVASGVLLLVRYRREPLDDGDDSARRSVGPLVLLGVASAVLLGVGTGSLLVVAALVSQALCTVRWRGGMRVRLVALTLVVVVAVWVIEATRWGPDGYISLTFALPLFAAMLAPLTATSLWWWDIVRELDRARRAEGRLAAAQERLRLASDLHDLQGHHLQVVALQLELAEKMMGRDPDAAVEQVRAARASVDEARRGTRDLAARFRGVPLPDELANAADLLRAAGLTVDLLVDTEAARAPADVLGPVVRESTTNVLKHGGGVSASLSLARHEGSWVLTVDNDARGAASPVGDGAGLSGIADRVGSVGGTMDAARLGDRFRLTVRVPEEVMA
ncbi:two-component system sensor histidine kinase DesK [Microbacterium sp. 1154]|uniref:sensor histidine kinase n=1 Tax=Microbacterium sp. 1154 TaxID=2817733 RepID=UPI0028609C69|nr:histidine kinase [Microbacterium sp. 1154]MDR6690305.1 two-component system sensor histidine kinase DesK [Microbacterium sp. 1154]